MIKKIRTRLKGEELAAFEATLADPAEGRVWRVRGDEELSRLLATLYAIQDARHDRSQQELLGRLTESGRIEVEIVVVESLGRADAFARVVYRTGPQGRKLIEITRDRLSADRVAVALETMSQMRQTYGSYPATRRVRFLRDDVGLGPEGAAYLEQAKEILSLIEAATGKDARDHSTAPRITVTLVH
ncbi:MAG: hypothetical protein KatS3mg081_0842 [Gemmatimonadales bacterium]|nr:MAG: hypothetical protein KatS3mg081_0842 [Gemmatimonadales bacterium]